MIAKFWSKSIGQLQSLFFLLRDAFFSRLSIQQANRDFKEDERKDALPLSLKQQIRETISALSLPTPEINQICQAFETSLAEWRMNSNVYNHTLVLLHTPTTAAALSSVLYKLAIAENFPLQPLDWKSRPESPNEIEAKLRQQIGGYLPQQKSEVVVIPDIELCFLRHMEGLNGIDFICQTLLKDSARFWVIVANTISWDYLAQVTRLNACCSAPIKPHELSGKELQEWLQPVIQKFGIIFTPSSLELPQSETEQNPEHQYFESLARITNGDRAIATEIFMHSLYLSQEEDSENEESSLMAQHPSLPPLPPLQAEDLYILYSLLLHGGLTFFSLAESLGHDPIKIQPRLQKLKASGIVSANEHLYQVKAPHYPRLKQMLMNSNFAIE